MSPLPNAYEQKEKKMGKMQIIVNIAKRCSFVDEDFIENVSFEE